jgi:hypothetical protein
MYAAQLQDRNNFTISNAVYEYDLRIEKMLADNLWICVRNTNNQLSILGSQAFSIIPTLVSYSYRIDISDLYEELYMLTRNRQIDSYILNNHAVLAFEEVLKTEFSGCTITARIEKEGNTMQLVFMTSANLYFYRGHEEKVHDIS